MFTNCQEDDRRLHSIEVLLHKALDLDWNLN